MRGYVRARQPPVSYAITRSMRRSDHAEELYKRAVRLLAGTGRVQDRLVQAAAEISTLHPEGMAGDIQQQHQRLLDALGDHAAIAALADDAASALALRVVEVFVVIKMHHGP